MSGAEEVKNKLDIVEVIREYITLKPSGRNFQALCPFHNEKTPSFVISPDKQIWHCFGCNKGGDIFGFVMEKEGLTFGEALRLLAQKAGVTLPQYSPELLTRRNRLLDCLASAVSFYHRVLLEAPAAERARQYLSGRGLTEETIEDWQLGFSPDSWDDLIIYLKGKGFVDREIAEAGLAVAKTGANRYFNRFRNRVMFPLTDVNADTVGFTARVLPGQEGKDGLGKYINSPQGPVYDKGKILFGLAQAKSAIREQDGVIIVEGQMDVIAAHQFGFKNTVAASGTALTAEQFQLLNRFTNNLLFALDADSAGQAATDRAGAVIAANDIATVEARDRFGRWQRYLDPAKSFKTSVRVAVLPSGKDPDECLRQDRAGWIRALSQAKPLLDYYFDKALAGLALGTAAGKRQAAQKLLPVLAEASNAVEKDFYLKKLANILDVEVRILAEAMPRRETRRETEPVKQSVVTAANREEILSEFLMALICRFPAGAGRFFEQVLPEHLQGVVAQLIYKNLFLYYNQIVVNAETGPVIFSLPYDDFRRWLSEREAAAARALDKLLILGEKEFGDWNEAAADLEVKRLAKILKRSYLNARLRVLTKLIAELESQRAERSELDALMREFNNLTQEIRKLLD